MANVEVKMNSAGAIELMNSYEMQQICLQHAQKIAESANAKGGGGYEANVQPGATRAHARATTASDHARKTEFNNNYLLKSIKG